MNIIILITSCNAHISRNAQCRATWLQNRSVDYRFVLGNGNVVEFGDELILPVDDSYLGLPKKISESHKWALEHGYDFICKTDCDVYLALERIFASDFMLYDYTGNFYYESFAMGACYWLSKKATEILVNSPLPKPFAPGGDDVWVGKVMSEAGVNKLHEQKYWIGENPNYDTFYSLHVSGPPKLDMFEIHKKVMGQ